MKKIAISMIAFSIFTLSTSFADDPPVSKKKGGDYSVLITEMEDAGFVLDFQDGFDEEWETDQWLAIEEEASMDFPELPEAGLSQEMETENFELEVLEFNECLRRIFQGEIDEENADLYCEGFKEELFEEFGVDFVEELVGQYELIPEHRSLNALELEGLLRSYHAPASGGAGHEAESPQK